MCVCCVCVYVNLTMWLSIYESVYLYVCFSVNECVCPCLDVYLSVCPDFSLASTTMSILQETDRWEPYVTGGGHFGPVCDLAWSTKGQRSLEGDTSSAGGGGDFLLTLSADQTTRLHAPWVDGDMEVGTLG